MLTLAFGKTIGEGKFMGERMMSYDSYGLGGIQIILCLITWVVVLALLISLTRFLWLKGDKEKKGK